MDAVVGKAEADQKRFHAEIGLEIADDRDRAAAAGHHGRLWPFVGQRGLRLGQERRVVGKLDGRGTAMRMELDRAVGRNALFHEFLESGAYFLWVLLVDEAERHLRRRLPRDHRLETLSFITAGNAVELRRRARPYHFRDRTALLAGRLGKANR